MKKIIDFLLQYRVFIFFNLLVFIAKIGYSYKSGFNGLTFEDWDIANNLVKYGTYAEFINVGPTAYKLPLYPFFLAFFIYFFGENAKAAVIISQHIIYFFIPLMFILITGIFDKKKIGIITGYLFIFSPAYFLYSNTLEITNVFIFIFLTFLYCFFLIWKKGYSPIRIILLAASAAMLFLSQVVAVPFSLLLIFSLLLFRKVTLKQLILMAGLTGILYSPWVIRNYLVFDRVIISKTPVWQNIHFGYFHEVQIFKPLQKISLQKGTEIRRMRTKTDEFTMEKIYEKEVRDIIKKDPCIAVKKAAANALMLWYVPSRYFYDDSLAIVLGRKIYVVILNLFSVLSLGYLYRKRNWGLFVFSIMLFINFTVPYMIGQAAMTRFKLDFEWFQLFLMAYFLFCRYLDQKTVLNPDK
ncbi:hypothetical protein [Chryseobacterium gossypii]|uniref:hypothetical protein n=1 Tax=Chryseobacterium gossypii TaxID=3231602 RepID=UPI003526C191